MVKEEIFGRTDEMIDKFGKDGTAYVGKIVSYPAGKYEEVGEVHLDLAFPHCMLVVGKRGTGKSYTLGVLSEGFGLMDKNMRDRVSVVIIDTMSVFHSLKTPNTNESEVDRLEDFKDLKPKGFGDFVDVFVPETSIFKQKKKGEDIYYDYVLKLPLNEVDISDWLSLFDLDITSKVGTSLSKIISDLKKKNEFIGFSDIYRSIDNSSFPTNIKETLRELFGMVEETGLFGKRGTSFGDLIEGGKVSVMDISYLGRLGNIDLRNVVVKIIADRLMRERTLSTTVEMQSQARLIDSDKDLDISKENPMVYLVMDEAHLFLPSDASTISSDVLIDWVKLGRHPGLSTIFCTQEPSAIHESVIRQSDLLIAHNVTSRDDIEALGKAKQSYMSSSEDIQKVVSEMEFKKGLTAIFDDKTRRMEMCRIRPRLSLHTGMDASLFSTEEVMGTVNEPSIDKEAPPKPLDKEGK